MKINEMTREQIESVPRRDWNEDIGEFDSMIILPMDELHDSDYRCMDYVAVLNDEPIRRLAGGSDVLHINGIGGYGPYEKRTSNWTESVRPISWSIDCLKVSGLLRIFSHEKLTVDSACSSMGVYSSPSKPLTNGLEE